MRLRPYRPSCNSLLRLNAAGPVLSAQRCRLKPSRFLASTATSACANVQGSRDFGSTQPHGVFTPDSQHCPVPTEEGPAASIASHQATYHPEGCGEDSELGGSGSNCKHPAGSRGGRGGRGGGPRGRHGGGSNFGLPPRIHIMGLLCALLGALASSIAEWLRATMGPEAILMLRAAFAAALCWLKPVLKLPVNDPPPEGAHRRNIPLAPTPSRTAMQRARRSARGLQLLVQPYIVAPAASGSAAVVVRGFAFGHGMVSRRQLQLAGLRGPTAGLPTSSVIGGPKATGEELTGDVRSRSAATSTSSVDDESSATPGGNAEHGRGSVPSEAVLRADSSRAREADAAERLVDVPSVYGLDAACEQIGHLSSAACVSGASARQACTASLALDAAYDSFGCQQLPSAASTATISACDACAAPSAQDVACKQLSFVASASALKAQDKGATPSPISAHLSPAASLVNPAARELNTDASAPKAVCEQVVQQLLVASDTAVATRDACSAASALEAAYEQMGLLSSVLSVAAASAYEACAAASAVDAVFGNMGELASAASANAVSARDACTAASALEDKYEEMGQLCSVSVIASATARQACAVAFALDAAYEDLGQLASASSASAASARDACTAAWALEAAYERVDHLASASSVAAASAFDTCAATSALEAAYERMGQLGSAASDSATAAREAYAAAWAVEIAYEEIGQLGSAASASAASARDSCTAASALEAAYEKMGHLSAAAAVTAASAQDACIAASALEAAQEHMGHLLSAAAVAAASAHVACTAASALAAAYEEMGQLSSAASIFAAAAFEACTSASALDAAYERLGQLSSAPSTTSTAASDARGVSSPADKAAIPDRRLGRIPSSASSNGASSHSPRRCMEVSSPKASSGSADHATSRTATRTLACTATAKATTASAEVAPTPTRSLASAVAPRSEPPSSSGYSVAHMATGKAAATERPAAPNVATYGSMAAARRAMDLPTSTTSRSAGAVNKLPGASRLGAPAAIGVPAAAAASSTRPGTSSSVPASHRSTAAASATSASKTAPAAGKITTAPGPASLPATTTATRRPTAAPGSSSKTTPPSRLNTSSSGPRAAAAGATRRPPGSGATAAAARRTATSSSSASASATPPASAPLSRTGSVCQQPLSLQQPATSVPMSYSVLSSGASTPLARTGSGYLPRQQQQQQPWMQSPGNLHSALCGAAPSLTRSGSLPHPGLPSKSTAQPAAAALALLARSLPRQQLTTQPQHSGGLHPAEQLDTASLSLTAACNLVGQANSRKSLREPPVSGRGPSSRSLATPARPPGAAPSADQSSGDHLSILPQLDPSSSPTLPPQGASASPSSLRTTDEKHPRAESPSVARPVATSVPIMSRRPPRGKPVEASALSADGLAPAPSGIAATPAPASAAVMAAATGRAPASRRSSADMATRMRLAAIPVMSLAALQGPRRMERRLSADLSVSARMADSESLWLPMMPTAVGAGGADGAGGGGGLFGLGNGMAALRRKAGLDEKDGDADVSPIRPRLQQQLLRAARVSSCPPLPEITRSTSGVVTLLAAVAEEAAPAGVAATSVAFTIEEEPVSDTDASGTSEEEEMAVENPSSPEAAVVPAAAAASSLASTGDEEAVPEANVPEAVPKGASSGDVATVEPVIAGMLDELRVPVQPPRSDQPPEEVVLAPALSSEPTQQPESIPVPAKLIEGNGAGCDVVLAASEPLSGLAATSTKFAPEQPPQQQQPPEEVPTPAAPGVRARHTRSISSPAELANDLHRLHFETETPDKRSPLAPSRLSPSLLPSGGGPTSPVCQRSPILLQATAAGIHWSPSRAALLSRSRRCTLDCVSEAGEEEDCLDGGLPLQSRAASQSGGSPWFRGTPAKAPKSFTTPSPNPPGGYYRAGKGSTGDLTTAAAGATGAAPGWDEGPLSPTRLSAASDRGSPESSAWPRTPERVSAVEDGPDGPARGRPRRALHRLSSEVSRYDAPTSSQHQHQQPQQYPPLCRRSSEWSESGGVTRLQSGLEPRGCSESLGSNNRNNVATALLLRSYDRSISVSRTDSRSPAVSQSGSRDFVRSASDRHRYLDNSATPLAHSRMGMRSGGATAGNAPPARTGWAEATSNSMRRARGSIARGLSKVLARSLKLRGSEKSSSKALVASETTSHSRNASKAPWAQVYDTPAAMLYERFSERHTDVTNSPRTTRTTVDDIEVPVPVVGASSVELLTVEAVSSGASSRTCVSRHEDRRRGWSQVYDAPADFLYERYMERHDDVKAAEGSTAEGSTAGGSEEEGGGDGSSGGVGFGYEQ